MYDRFCPSVFLYLASVCPSIWLIELDKLETRLEQKERLGEAAGGFEALDQGPVDLHNIINSSESMHPNETKVDLSVLKGVGVSQVFFQNLGLFALL
jgi:hypothetical protein